MTIKNKILNTAIVLSLSASSVAFNTAQAGSFAEAVVEVNNLLFSQGGTTLDIANFDLTNFTSSGDTTATLNGTSVSDDAPALARFNSDLLSTVGSTSYVDNSFAISTGSPVGNYAIGDQFENGSPVAGFSKDSAGNVVASGTLGSVPVTTGAYLKNASYVSLESAGNGSSTSNNGLESKFSFTGISGSIDIDFGIIAYLETFLDIGDVAPSTASAALSVIFSLKEVGGFGGSELILDNGTSTNGLTGLGGIFAQTGAANAPGAGFGGVFGAAPGVAFDDAFKLHTADLDENKTYQLSARLLTAADAAQVPEPTVIALMGLGLLGLSVTRKRTVK